MTDPGRETPMNDHNTPGWTSWVASSYGTYGPYLSPLDAYRAEREAESLDRITERLDEARQAQEEQRQSIRDSLARARQAQAARTGRWRQGNHQPDAPASPSPATGSVQDRLRQVRRDRTTPTTTERLPVPDEPGLWPLEELVPPADAELVDEPPLPGPKERESDEP
nr:hypothetical protein GCM10017745_35820 [Saccharothrix mutabilis subsp. capreolus]